MKLINKFGESFTITPYLVHRIIKSIKCFGCKCIIAPYEADAQLAYLFHSGKVDIVFTEDSDLIAYGVTKLMYRLDNDGDGYELDMTDVFEKDSQNSDKIRDSQDSTDNSKDPDDVVYIGEIQSKSSSLYEESKHGNSNSSGSPRMSKPKYEKDFTKKNFLAICILAGCDYLEPIKGIGFKTAIKLFKEYKSIERVLESVRSLRKYTVPKNYETNFHLAYMTFLYQIVYDYETEE